MMVGIKGMKMPTCCAECDFRKDDMFSPIMFCSKAFGEDIIIDEYKKLDNCPLVEVITCKSAISREEVLEMIEQIRDAGGFIGYNTYSEAFDKVDNMRPIEIAVDHDAVLQILNKLISESEGKE